MFAAAAADVATVGAAAVVWNACQWQQLAARIREWPQLGRRY